VGLNRAECDLRNLDAVKDQFDAIKPDVIFHLASKMAPGRSISDIQEHIEANIQATANVCLAAPTTLRLLIMFGSSDEYGGNVAPFDERMPTSAISIYGWSKISAFSLAQILCHQRSIPYTWLRPSLFFGPGVSERLFFGHVLYKCQRGESVALTPCEQTRDFLYINDFAEMMLSLLANVDRARGCILNTSSGQPRRLREVAELIQKTVGRGQLLFGAIPYRSNEIMNFYSSPARFNSMFGRAEFTSFEVAVKETVDRSVPP
jgi:nucleoside-diphosphate-sugar epimerase